MKIEDEIFKRYYADFKKLEKYGFVKIDNIYKYSKIFMESFRADIFVDEKGRVSGKIFDLSVDEEYTNFRVLKQTGEFVISIRDTYQEILLDIAKNCFIKNYFITSQANRITELIKETYYDEPEFPWESTPGAGIFRNPNNQKWYGLIMNIDKSKLDKQKSGEVEIINLKLDAKEIPNLLKKKGIYPAYHMNKKNWVSIILDDTLEDTEIMDYIMVSHRYTETTDEWLIPANPKFYNVINCFNDVNTINWKQSSDIKIGDIVYLYVGAPYSAVFYKCEAIKVNIPYEYQDNNLKMNRVMTLKLLEKYNHSKYSFAFLNTYGVRAIRGPRRIPLKLSKELNR
ncbi:MAG: hypothetical protein HFI86_04635 [Bacilli bacterium]|nr:hypothetical protein [Bacilli bacterium]